MSEASMASRFSADPELWTRLRRWTPAEVLSGPGRSVKRRALLQATDDDPTREFLAELPDDRSRIVAVANVFGPNLMAEDIAEFLTAIGPRQVFTAQVAAVMTGPDAVDGGEPVASAADETPTTRTEIAQLTAAVRCLTQTLDSVLGELGSRVTAVEKVLDDGMTSLAGEVSEVGAELSQIGAALQRIPEAITESDGWMPVRRWRFRRGGGRR
ncbi:hypothetical protein [Actinomadura nitritigenes]|uniref:hypothetical protein n=1 Tax=Actinomadura nitritigenes TaxID=134602 RepID=UPI003D8C73B5